MAGLAGRRPEDVLHRWTGTEAAPPENLPPYQRSLLVWARDHVLPDLDVRAPGAYVAARRRLWYSHRREVLGFLARGAGLDPGAGGRLDAAVEGLDDDDRARFSVWLLGSGREALKLELLQGLAQGRVFGYWRSLGTALGESSVLPWSAKIAFMEADAPDADSIPNLPQAAHVLDHWQITARAYTETMVALRQAQWERAAAGDEKIASRSYARSRELWRSGGPDHMRSFLADTRRTGREVRTAQETLLGLATADQNAGGEGAEAAVRGSVAEAATTLARARSVVGDLSGTADRLGTGIGDRMAELSHLYRQDLSAPAAPWWARASRSLGEALGGFSDQLRNPDNWKLALEVGLEIAGTVATGGAALAARVGKWLLEVRGGLAERLGQVQEWLEKLGSAEGLSSLLPVDRLFSLTRLEMLGIDALFGRAGADRAAEDRKRETSAGDRSKGGFGAAAAALAHHLGRIYARGREGLDNLLARLDQTGQPWFAPFVRAYAAALRHGRRAVNLVTHCRTWVAKTRGRLSEYLEGMETRARDMLAVLRSPGQAVRDWSRRLVSAAVGYLLRLLLTRPPSAALKVALRTARSAVDLTPEEMVDRVRSTVPGADALLGRIEEAAAEPVASRLEPAAKAAFGFGADRVESVALPAITAAGRAFDGALDGLEAKLPAPGDDRDGAADRNPGPGRVQRRPQVEERPGTGTRRMIQRQPETVYMLLHNNTLFWSRRQEAIEKYWGTGAQQAPEKRRLALGKVGVDEAKRHLKREWGEPKPRLRDTRRRQVTWGSFEIFGTLDQLWAFVEQVERVLAGRDARPQGARLVPGETGSAEFLEDALKGLAPDTFFDLRGEEGEVRSSLLRWLLAIRAMSHFANDQDRIMWTFMGTSDFEWMYDRRERSPPLPHPDHARATLRERHPQLVEGFRRDGGMPVLLLCYQFVLYLKMRLGNLSASEVMKTYLAAEDERGTFSASPGLYRLLGAGGPGHRPLYVRPGSGIAGTEGFPAANAAGGAGFVPGASPRVGSPLFIWEKSGGGFIKTHVALCVTPDLYVGLDSDHFNIETAAELLRRYGDDLHGMTYAPPLV